jgi:hypothetical protein
VRRVHRTAAAEAPVLDPADALRDREAHLDLPVDRGVEADVAEVAVDALGQRRQRAEGALRNAAVRAEHLPAHLEQAGGRRAQEGDQRLAPVAPPAVGELERAHLQDLVVRRAGEVLAQPGDQLGCDAGARQVRPARVGLDGPIGRRTRRRRRAGVELLARRGGGGTGRERPQVRERVRRAAKQVPLEAAALLDDQPDVLRSEEQPGQERALWVARLDPGEGDDLGTAVAGRGELDAAEHPPEGEEAERAPEVVAADGVAARRRPLERVLDPARDRETRQPAQQPLVAHAACVQVEKLAEKRQERRAERVLADDARAAGRQRLGPEAHHR